MTQLTFTPGNHSYWLTDPTTGRKHRLTSVTTLLSQIDKPALKRWAANTAADYATDYWDDLTTMSPSQRRAAIAQAPWQSSGKKAASGTAVHHLAESLMAGEPVEVPPELRGYVEGLARWIEHSGFTSDLTECRVWSDDDDDLGAVGFAGTFDALGKHPRHGRTLVDWKTAKGVWPENGVQLAGYSAARWLVRDDVDVPMPTIDTLAVVHIRPDGTDMHTLTPDQRHIATLRFEVLRMLKAAPEPSLQMEATP